MTANSDDDAHAFLIAYLNSGAERGKLITRLARSRWSRVFSFLVLETDVPDDARPVLMDAAIRAFDPGHGYELPAELGAFLVRHLHNIAAFADAESDSAADKLAILLERTDTVIPNLEAASPRLRKQLVASNRYEITARNLRVAASADGTPIPEDIGLERISEHADVYSYCLGNPEQYFQAIDQDQATTYAVSQPGTLIEVLIDTAESWAADQLNGLLSRAAPESRLMDLRSAPISAWPHLAAAQLIHPSLANIEHYRQETGAIDEDLAAMLERGGIIHVSEGSDSSDDAGEELDHDAAALAILNAQAISAPGTRVALAGQLNINRPLPVSEITAESSDLFSHLLTRDLVEDSAESFLHFHQAGWTAIGPAIVSSSNIGDFLTGEIVRGMVADLLTDPATRDKVGPKVMAEAEDFVLDDDIAALRAVSLLATNWATPLQPETVARIARTSAVDPQTVLNLLRGASPQATAQQVIEVFTSIGAPYSEITRNGAEFEVHYDEPHGYLLGVLESERVCTFKKKRLQNLYVVQVT